MFVYSSDRLVLSEARLHSLYPSLNSPVVQVDELPLGPVRASIVIYAEDYGDLGLAVGLRAIESGDVALYAYRGGIPDTGEIPAAIEDALHFAEGLGFLFDDNMLVAASNADRRVALEHWNELMGGPGGLGAEHAFEDADTVLDVCPPDLALTETMEVDLDPADDLLPEDGAADALLLDDLAAAASQTALLDPDVDPFETAAIEDLVSEQDLQPTRAPLLTKFRGAGDLDEPVLVEPDTASAKTKITAPTESLPPDLEAAALRSADAMPSEEGPAGAVDPTPGGRALGRIPIVRKRRSTDGSRPSYVSRLLASF